MRTRLSSKQTIAKDLSFVKEGGELFFNGDEFENARWVTVVGVPDEDNVAEDTEIECVDEKGRKFNCFADQLSPKDSSGAGVDDPAYFKVAKTLRRAADGYVNQKFASVKKVAKDDEEDGTWCPDCMDEVEGEVKDFGEWIVDLAKEENLSDEAVEVLENYSFNVGEKPMCHDCAHAKMESIFDESPELKNRGRKTASVKVAKKEDEDKDVFTIDLFNETKADGVDTKETTKVYYDADEAIKVAEELIKEYADEEDEYTVSVYAGEYEKPSGDIYGEVTSIWEKSNKGEKKIASHRRVGSKKETESQDEETDDLKVVTFKTTDKYLVDILQSAINGITISTTDDVQTFGPTSFGDFNVLGAKETKKTASRRKTAAEGDAEVAPKPTGELTSEDMWSWLQKQAQYKSVVETISNEIANNAVEDVMFGRALNQNPAGGTVQNAYDWAVRLLKNQFASQIGKMRVQKNVEPVDAPEIPEMPEVEESVEVEAKTASRRRLTSK